VAPSVQHRKVWLMPTTRVPCSNAAKMWNLLNLLGSPKQPNRSQPLVGWSSPYCGDMWKRYCCLTSFFSNCWYMPHLQGYSPTKLCDDAQIAIFASFLHPVFPASRVQHISDLHSKFALRPHHV